MSGRTIGLMGSQSSAIWSRLDGLRASFARDAIVNFAGAGLARAVTLASLPFVTRIYAPADLGVWVIVFTLANFVLPLATLRYDVAVVIAPTRRMAAALVVFIGVCTFAVAATLALAMWAAPTSLLETISGLGANSQSLLFLAPIVLVQLALQVALQAWLTRERMFGVLSLAKFIQAVVTAAITLALPFVAGASAGVATAAAMLGLMTGLAVTAWACVVGMLPFVHRGIGHTARSAVLRYKVYPLYVLPYALSAGLVERVLQLVLASAYSIGALGAFYIGRQLVTAPILVLSAALSQVVFAHSAAQNNLAQTKNRIDLILRLLIDVQAAGLAFCLFWMKPVLAILMDASWARLGDFAWWSLFPAGMLLLTGWLDRILDVLGRQRLAVGLQIVSDAVLIGLALLSPIVGLDEVGLVAALSIGIALYNLIWLGITLRILTFGRGEILVLALRACSLCLLWSGLQYVIVSFLPGPFGFAAACVLLALSLARPAYKVASHFRLGDRGESR